MRSHDFISTEEVVAEAVEIINDSDFTHGVNRTFYELIAHRTIEDLALSTFFERVTKDIFNWNCSGNFTVDIPKNMFNIREIYFFNSSCDPNREGFGCCSTPSCSCSSNEGTPPMNCYNGGQAGTGLGNNMVFQSCCLDMSCWKTFVPGYWKRQFNRFGSSGKATSERPWRHDWIGYVPRLHGDPKWQNLVYFGIQNGQICVSDSGKCYKNMRIVSNGFGTDNCELPIIPRELRNVVVDTIVFKGCQRMMILFPEYRPLLQMYKENLYGDGRNNVGSWTKAERFIKSLNSKQREDFNLYYSNADIK